MKTLLFLLVAVVSLVTSFTAHAAETADGPAQVAEKFYAGYVAQVDANKDTKVWVAKSTLVTTKFKKAYAKVMNAEEVDADPVLKAQDIPSKPFKAQTPVIQESTATVVLVTHGFGEEPHKVTVMLVKTDSAWLLDAVK